MDAIEFGKRILKKEGYDHWDIILLKMGGGGRVSKMEMAVLIDENNKYDFGLVLHEIAHITSDRLTGDSHDVLYADALTELIRKYMSPNLIDEWERSITPG